MKSKFFALIILCQLAGLPCIAESANLAGVLKSQELQAGTIVISNSTSYVGSITITNNISILSGGTLTISGTATMNDDTVIRVYSGGALVIDAGTLQNAYVVLYSGSTLTIRNDGIINRRSGVDFSVPTGAVVTIESGTVN